VQETKLNSADRFPVTQHDEISQPSDVIRAINGVTFQAFVGAKIVLPGRKAFELKAAGPIRSRGRPTAWSALER
jgi:hypothetical protein